MNKLHYTSFTEMAADLARGACFEVVTQQGRFPVKSITALNTGRADIKTEGGTLYTSFKVDGSNSNGTANLMLICAAPTQKTFAERFFAGEDFHSPHTRETVQAVYYNRAHNRLDVTLRDDYSLKERVSTHYSLDGTHKLNASRSLVAGKLPPKMVDVEVTIYKNRRNGSLFCIRKGEVLPQVSGVHDAFEMGKATIQEIAPKPLLRST